MISVVRLAAIVVLAVALAPAALAAPGPAVRLVAVAPASVRGVGFAPGERVSVTVSAGGRRLTAHVTAGSGGGFVARWKVSAPAATCHAGIAVLAVGSRGHRAAWKAPLPSCGTPQQPIDQ